MPEIPKGRLSDWWPTCRRHGIKIRSRSFLGNANMTHVQVSRRKSKVLFSLKPRYAEGILEGLKTVELRRRCGSLSAGTKMVIYSSAPISAIVGEVEISGVQHTEVARIWHLYGQAALIEKPEFDRYFQGIDRGYAIGVCAPRRYRNPIPLSHLKNFGFRAPQSYMFVAEWLDDIVGGAP